MRTAKQSRETWGGNLAGNRVCGEGSRVMASIWGYLESQGRGRASQGCVEPGVATASLSSSQTVNLKDLSFPICKIGLVDRKDALQL